MFLGCFHPNRVDLWRAILLASGCLDGTQVTDFRGYLGLDVLRCYRLRLPSLGAYSRRFQEVCSGGSCRWTGDFRRSLALSRGAACSLGCPAWGEPYRYCHHPCHRDDSCSPFRRAYHPGGIGACWGGLRCRRMVGIAAFVDEPSALKVEHHHPCSLDGHRSLLRRVPWMGGLLRRHHDRRVEPRRNRLDRKGPLARSLPRRAG